MCAAGRGENARERLGRIGRKTGRSKKRERKVVNLREERSKTRRSIITSRECVGASERAKRSCKPPPEPSAAAAALQLRVKLGVYYYGGDDVSRTTYPGEVLSE